MDYNVYQFLTQVVGTDTNIRFPMVQTNGRADVRTVIWPPKFLACIDNQPFLLMVLCREIRAKDQIQFPGSNSESFADFSATINFMPDVCLSSQTNLNRKPWNKEARPEISVLFPHRLYSDKKRRKPRWIWVEIVQNDETLSKRLSCNFSADFWRAL